MPVLRQLVRCCYVCQCGACHAAFVFHVLTCSQLLQVTGYAYSGGGQPIIRVDVSADGGANWTTAQLQAIDARRYRHAATLLLPYTAGQDSALCDGRQRSVQCLLSTQYSLLLNGAAGEMLLVASWNTSAHGLLVTCSLSCCILHALLLLSQAITAVQAHTCQRLEIVQVWESAWRPQV